MVSKLGVSAVACITSIEPKKKKKKKLAQKPLLSQKLKYKTFSFKKPDTH